MEPSRMIWELRRRGFKNRDIANLAGTTPQVVTKILYRDVECIDYRIVDALRALLEVSEGRLHTTPVSEEISELAYQLKTKYGVLLTTMAEHVGLTLPELSNVLRGKPRNDLERIRDRLKIMPPINGSGVSQLSRR